MKEKNSIKNDIIEALERIWRAFIYLFVFDDFKIIKSDKQLLKFSILYKFVYWFCICFLIFTCFPLLKSLVTYSLKCSTCSQMSFKAYMKVLEMYMKLFAITAFSPVLVGSVAYFRIQHIRSIKFYRKRLNMNS
jgi:hypothetical protein